jgi:hypothetical protein
VKLNELSNGHLTVDELIGLTKDEPIVLRQPDGSQYAILHVELGV